ncbi:hypothetical protein L9F63_018082, partial [Diploptera punctata]
PDRTVPCTGEKCGDPFSEKSTTVLRTEEAALHLGFIQLGAMMSSLKMAIPSYISLCGTPLNSLVDSIKSLFSAYTENMIEVFKLYNYYRVNRFLRSHANTLVFTQITSNH